MDFQQLLKSKNKAYQKRRKNTIIMNRLMNMRYIPTQTISSNSELLNLSQQLKKDAEILETMQSQTTNQLKDTNGIINDYNVKISNATTENEKNTLRNMRDTAVDEKNKFYNRIEQHKNTMSEKFKRMSEILRNDPSNIFNKKTVFDVVDPMVIKAITAFENKDKKIVDELNNLDNAEKQKMSEKLINRLEDAIFSMRQKRTFDYNDLQQFANKLELVANDKDPNEKYVKLIKLKDEMNKYINDVNMMTDGVKSHIDTNTDVGTVKPVNRVLDFFFDFESHQKTPKKQLNVEEQETPRAQMNVEEQDAPEKRVTFATEELSRDSLFSNIKWTAKNREAISLELSKIVKRLAMGGNDLSKNDLKALQDWYVNDVAPNQNTRQSINRKLPNEKDAKPLNSKKADKLMEQIVKGIVKDDKKDDDKPINPFEPFGDLLDVETAKELARQRFLKEYKDELSDDDVPQTEKMVDTVTPAKQGIEQEESPLTKFQEAPLPIDTPVKDGNGKHKKKASGSQPREKTLTIVI